MMKLELYISPEVLEFLKTKKEIQIPKMKIKIADKISFIRIGKLWVFSITEECTGNTEIQSNTEGFEMLCKKYRKIGYALRDLKKLCEVETEVQLTTPPEFIITKTPARIPELNKTEDVPVYKRLPGDKDGDFYLYKPDESGACYIGPGLSKSDLPDRCIIKTDNTEFDMPVNSYRRGSDRGRDQNRSRGQNQSSGLNRGSNRGWGRGRSRGKLY